MGEKTNKATTAETSVCIDVALCRSSLINTHGLCIFKFINKKLDLISVCSVHICTHHTETYSHEQLIYFKKILDLFYFPVYECSAYVCI